MTAPRNTEEAIILLVDLIEITTNNPYTGDLQKSCYLEFERMIEHCSPGFILGVILEARRRAVRDAKGGE